MKIVCLGDSLTAGLDSASPDHWLNILEREARNTYVNKGICGDTSGGMLARFHRDVVQEGAKSVILMGGINDFMMGCEPEVVQANMMAMVHQAFYHKIIPVIGVPIRCEPTAVRKDWAEFTDFSKVLDKYERYRDWIYRFSCAFATEVLDFQSAFEREVTGAWSDYFSDGMHPNAKGNRIMADLIIKSGM